MNEVLKNRLKALGFETIKDENAGITDYVNKVNEKVRLVISPTFNEVFIWVIDEGAQDEDMDGTKIVLNTDNLEKAIDLSKIIVGIDNGF